MFRLESDWGKEPLYIFVGGDKMNKDHTLIVKRTDKRQAGNEKLCVHEDGKQSLIEWNRWDWILCWKIGLCE